jgi:hypothetical protein
MNTADLRFNIFFTPDTAEYLDLFIDTLLEWSDSRYRIVSNGCSEADCQLFSAICAADARLDFLAYSDNTMVEHGLVLD